MTLHLSNTYQRTFTALAPDCTVLPEEVESAGGLIALVDSWKKNNLWFRGQANAEWKLVPKALRPRGPAKRKQALALIRPFRNQSLPRLDQSPPSTSIGWHGLAQHHGLPTRLLDWTANPAVALYFACLAPKEHGAVYVIDPIELNTLSLGPSHRRILDPEDDAQILEKYLRLGPEIDRNGLMNVALDPAYESKRIEAQEGCFTLHGNRHLGLTGKQAPSMFYIPILRRHKVRILRQLAQIGFKESKLFPELEYLCRELRRKAGLT